MPLNESALVTNNGTRQLAGFIIVLFAPCGFIFFVFGDEFGSGNGVIDSGIFLFCCRKSVLSRLACFGLFFYLRRL